MPDDVRKTLSLEQACSAADVSRRTMYNWMTAGKVEFRMIPGGTSRRIFEDSLPHRSRRRKRQTTAPAVPPEQIQMQ